MILAIVSSTQLPGIASDRHGHDRLLGIVKFQCNSFPGFVGLISCGQRDHHLILLARIDLLGGQSQLVVIDRGTQQMHRRVAVVGDIDALRRFRILRSGDHDLFGFDLKPR